LSKSEGFPNAKTNKSWKTSFWVNSMEFSRLLKRFKGRVRFAFVMTISKKISSFLHVNVKAHAPSFIQNVSNSGLIVKSKKKL
jgi:hypothetical protein